MVKYNFNPFTSNFDQVLNLDSPFQYKGSITLPADFPSSPDNGWMYTILADVIDNDGTKTNTGQSFDIGDEIVWDGSAWVILGNENKYVPYTGATGDVDLGDNKLKVDGWEFEGSLYGSMYFTGDGVGHSFNIRDGVGGEVITIQPRHQMSSENEADLGLSVQPWGTLYINTIDLGTNTITDLSMTGAWDMNSGAMTNVNIDSGNIDNAVVNTEWDTAYDHSQIITGNPHVIDITDLSSYAHDSLTDKNNNATYQHITTTQETNFQTAYDHSQDNTQAHSDYLLNNADDVTTFKLTLGALIVDKININDDDIYTLDAVDYADAEDINITAGDGGLSYGLPGTYGGSINFKAGAGGGYGPGIGGSITFEAGTGDANGHINILGATGGATAGNIYMTARNSATSDLGEVHIKGTALGGDAGVLYLQEDAGGTVIGDSGAHAGIKVYVQGDDGGIVASPAVCQFLAGEARENTDGNDTIFEATNAGTGNQSGGDILFKPGALTGTGSDGSCKFGVATTTNYAEFAGDGDLIFHGTAGLPYGIIAGDDESIVCTTQGTDYQVTFDACGDYNLTTCSAANNEIKIQKAGTYQISMHFSAHAANANDFEVCVKKNNGATDLFHCHAFITTLAGSKIIGSSVQTIDELSVDDTIEVWTKCTDAASKTLIFDHVSLNLTMIGG